MAAYYNENDKFAAAWLRNLIAENLIAPGDVDERSILKVKPEDLRGYKQCHFFAGIGGWSYALRLAGWPDDRPVWTGSCPCQPFSVAGKKKGFDDERHLWPVWFNLIKECRPSIVFGEQVASKAGVGWFSGVRSDVELLSYSVGAADLPAACVGAPHKRNRLFWVAYTDGGFVAERQECDGGQHGFWSQNTISFPCTDGNARRIPTEPSFQPMAHGVPGRLQQLRAYGNAIVPHVAAQFIIAVSEAIV